MTLLKIGGVALPPPTSYSVTQSDLDSADSGRSETGKMHRHRVRKNVTKIEVAWEKLTQSEMATVLVMAEDEELNVDFFFGKEKSATMYAGDRKVDLVCIDSSGQSRWNVSYNLVEF